MLCAISLIFIASIISSLEADTITEIQAIFYSIYRYDNVLLYK